MELVLCDDLIKEILQRLPRSSRLSACLVCKCWRFLLSSSSATSLTICAHRDLSNLQPSAAATSLSSVLSHYPSLSNLTVMLYRNCDYPDPANALLFADGLLANALLFAVAASPCTSRLSYLCLLTNFPVTPSALLSSAPAFPHLTALTIASLFPVSFRWLSSLPSLKSFTLTCTFRELARPKKESNAGCSAGRLNDDDECANNPAGLVPLPLESLSLVNIPGYDFSLAWLWRRCSNLRRLHMQNCSGINDYPPSPALLPCLSGLLSLELYSCGHIENIILRHAADHCLSLTSLRVFYYVCPDVLHQFVRRRGAGLCTLEFTIPFDLKDNHLFALAANGGCSTSGVSGSQLRVLRLEHCHEITAKGLRSLALSPACAAIEELALVNCSALKGKALKAGLLTLLVQSMQRLQKLDLHSNNQLADEDIEAMLENCRNLVDIALDNCTALTSSSLLSILKHRGHHLQVVDITKCPRIESDAIEKLVLNACNLRQLMVEENRVSQAAKGLLSRRGIEIRSQLTTLPPLFIA